MKYQKGFSVIEYVIVLGFCIIITSIIFQLFDLGSKSYQKSIDQIEVGTSIRYPYIFLEKQIKSSDEIIVKDGIVYLQDLESPDSYYNYYELKNNLIYRYKVNPTTLIPISLGGISQFAINIQSFSLVYNHDNILSLNIIAQKQGDSVDMKTDIRVGCPIIIK